MSAVRRVGCLAAWGRARGCEDANVSTRTSDTKLSVEVSYLQILSTRDTGAGNL